MACFNFIFLLYISSAVFLIEQCSTIPTEKIMGSELSETDDISYLIAIVGKTNLSDERSLYCNGGLLTKNLALTVAQCFVNASGLLTDDSVLKRYQYSIIAATDRWSDGTGIEIIIDLIFLPSSGDYELDDIAITKLERDLNVDNSPYLRTLRIPLHDESFYELVGLVAGYGDNWVDVKRPRGTSKWIKVRSGSRNEKRKVDVSVTMNINCAKNDGAINPDKQFCGVVPPRNYESYPGLCDNDEGSPLVINNTIVGLGSIVRDDCYDLEVGTVYTKVSSHAPFVNSVVEGTPLPGTFIYINRNHILKKEDLDAALAVTAFATLAVAE